MSRPGNFNPGNPFVKAKRKPGGKKVGIDIERITPSDNHRANANQTVRLLIQLQVQLVDAERAGRWSKARKLRREINRYQEVEIYLTHSWCLGCNNVLHNCQCKEK